MNDGGTAMFGILHLNSKDLCQLFQQPVNIASLPNHAIHIQANTTDLYLIPTCKNHLISIYLRLNIALES